MQTPSEYFKAPIVGKVKTKTLNLSYVMNGRTEVKECPSAEYDVFKSSSSRRAKPMSPTSGMPSTEKNP